MKKTLIAMTAVLAGSFALSAQADMKLSGQIEQALTIASTTPDGGDSVTTNSMANYSTLYVTSNEDLGGSLKLTASYGLGVADAVAGNDTRPNIALSGDFGKITLGGGLTTGTKALAGGTGSWKANGVNPSNATLGGVRNAGPGFSYSNSVGGGIAFSFTALSGDEYDADATTTTKSNLMHNTGIKVAYSNAGITAGFATNSEKNTADEEKTNRQIIAFGYTMGNMKFSLGNSTQKNGDTTTTGTYIDANIGMGENTIHLGYGTTEVKPETGDTTDGTNIGFEFVHAMSSNTSAYLGYGSNAIEGGNTDTKTSIGVQHSF